MRRPRPPELSGKKLGKRKRPRERKMIPNGSTQGLKGTGTGNGMVKYQVVVVVVVVI